MSEQAVARRYRGLLAAGALRVQCRPDATAALAGLMAARNDVSWVSITSGGSEIV